jgi:hypothetical protein
MQSVFHQGNRIGQDFVKNRSMDKIIFERVNPYIRDLLRKDGK